MCCFTLLSLIALTSNGFETSRRLAQGLPYHNADRLIIVSEKGVFMGQRFGFSERHLATLRQHSKSIEGMASYIWHTEVFASSGTASPVPGRAVSRDFFHSAWGETQIG